MRFIFPLILAIGLALGARLFYWQILQWDLLSARALTQQLNEEPIHAPRGDIKTNDGVILAREVYLYTVRLTIPAQGLSKPQEWARDLAPILNQTYDQVLAKLTAKGKVISLATDTTAKIGEGMREYKNTHRISNLEITSRAVRTYPLGRFAAQVIGFVNLQGVAALGIELGKETELRGVDGKKGGTWTAFRDDRIPIELPDDVPPIPGAEIILTINSRIQRIVETELERAVRDARASSGTIIVMDPQTGAVLAMASYPSTDLNAYSNPANVGKYNNPAISAQFEPGSIFKVITIAAALEAETISSATVFEDNGVYPLGGREIFNHDKIAPGRVNLVDVFKLSLNVEAAKISVGMGAARFYESVRNFGFGARTRIELAAEIAGEVRIPGSCCWHDIDLGTNAYGQGIAVTPLQAISAIAAVANQGKLMKPYIVQNTRLADGRNIKTNPEVVRQVIRPATARLVTELLAQAIGAESSNKALVPGYRIAGKTGTASIPIAGGLDPNATIASFVGYLPADEPRVVVLVKIDKPQTSEWGSQIASPVFASVAKQIAPLLGILPDEVRAKTK
ncbi:MAG: penicillin-binding protein 2 [Chloroflexi bacterium]|nr:penicillin-binding protein 2 [Chloroflexota bacterium]